MVLLAGLSYCNLWSTSQTQVDFVDGLPCQAGIPNYAGYDGTLCDAKLYNAVLTPTQVESLYSLGEPYAAEPAVFSPPPPSVPPVPPPPPAPPAPPALSSLVAWWPFDGSYQDVYGSLGGYAVNSPTLTTGA
jgi:hypothetical protein